MYGFKRTNIQRPVVEHPSIGVLRAKGLGVVDQLDGSYLIVGAILYWPATKFWKRDEQIFGFGVDTLIAAVLPAASADMLPAVDVMQ